MIHAPSTPAQGLAVVIAIVVLLLGAIAFHRWGEWDE